MIQAAKTASGLALQTESCQVGCWSLLGGCATLYIVAVHAAGSHLGNETRCLICRRRNVRHQL